MIRVGLIKRKIGALLAAALLAVGCGSFAGSASASQAEAHAAVDEAQSVLDAAEAEMQSIVQEYDQIKGEVQNLQSQIEESAAHAFEAQNAVLKGRENLSQAVAYDYRNNTTESILSILLGSASFEDLFRNIEYCNHVYQHQAEQIESQKQRQQQFTEATEALNNQVAEQETNLSELEVKRAAAEEVVANAEQSLADAQAAEEAARIQALIEQASSLKQQQSAEPTLVTDKVDESGETVQVPAYYDDVSGQVYDESGAVAEEYYYTEPEPEPAVEDAIAEDISWSSGSASAYGGSTDPNTPNGATTSNGDVCDDDSMGVAIPMSWPNYSSYFGRTVEISYNGTTVYATVNDCGDLAGGSRDLDLQPGVWQALGFDSCADWGVREVSYRFL